MKSASVTTAFQIIIRDANWTVHFVSVCVWNSSKKLSAAIRPLADRRADSISAQTAASQLTRRTQCVCIQTLSARNPKCACYVHYIRYVSIAVAATILSEWCQFISEIGLWMRGLLSGGEWLSGGEGAVRNCMGNWARGSRLVVGDGGIQLRM